MDEPQRERDPESYFGAGAGGGNRLFTAGGRPDGPQSPAPAAPSVATVTEPAREIPVHEWTGVVVGGRHVASDAATQAFMREIPQCWMTGQAAGTAAGLAARTGLAPRALDVKELRKELRRQGAFPHEP